MEFGEKAFYLDEFRARTLCLAVPLTDCERPGGFETLGKVVRELIGNATRVIVLLGVPPTRSGISTRMQQVRRRLGRVALSNGPLDRFSALRGRRDRDDLFLDLSGSPGGDDDRTALELVWRTLRTRPLVVGLVEALALVQLAQQLAGHLRVYKLVIIESHGGIASTSASQLPFMDDSTLTAVLRAGEAEWAGLAGRRSTLQAIQAALRGGVHSVNLCSLKGLPRELYTYEGAGTLFTLTDYCRVERLGIDDSEAVERLIVRGHREGYLKPRDHVETTRLLLNGFGATIGRNHFAGVCGLETAPYKEERAGEIVGLYTITRFKEEGVGVRLIARVLAEARELRLAYVFACAVNQRAQAFFSRQGFRVVAPRAVPAAKWIGYDRDRRSRVKIYRRDIEVVPDAR